MSLPAHPHPHLCPALTHPLRLDLQPGELPRCFEGELRRGPQQGAELMHLVSGRTLLGVVRLRVGVRRACAAVDEFQGRGLV